MGHCLVSAVIQPKILPKVLVDARMVTDVPHGIARYVTEMAKGLEGLQKREPLPYQPVFIVNSDWRRNEFSSFETLPTSIPFLNPYEILEIPRTLKQAGAALYHSPSFSSLWNCPCPSLVTIHDLNHLSYGGLSKKVYYQILLRRFALQSQAIITVSEFSKKEISSWLKLSDSRIEVVHNSLDFVDTPGSSADSTSDALFKKWNLTPGQYFFCLSNSKPHKNLSLLVDAYQGFRQQQSQAWPLALSVSCFESKPGVIPLGSLTQSESSLLLSHAAGMFFPSLYEGFGLPPLEAALFGIPLVISRIPPHEEGLVDLSPHEVLWVAPRDQHGWTRSFHRIQNREISGPAPQSREKIRLRFNSERIGQRMDQIYRRVLRLQT